MEMQLIGVLDAFVNAHDHHRRDLNTPLSLCFLFTHLSVGLLFGSVFADALLQLNALFGTRHFFHFYLLVLAHLSRSR